MSLKNIENRLRRLATIGDASVLKRAAYRPRKYIGMEEAVDVDMSELPDPQAADPEVEACVLALAPIVHVREQLEGLQDVITTIIQLDPNDAEWRRISLSRLAQRLRGIADDCERSAKP